MYCKHCGAQNPDGVNFCTSCGASMNDEAQTVRCPNCGAQNAAGVKFCTSCGAALDTQNTNQQQNTYQQQTYQNTNGQANAQFAGQTFNFHTDPMQVQSRNTQHRFVYCSFHYYLRHLCHCMVGTACQ